MINEEGGYYNLVVSYSPLNVNALQAPGRVRPEGRSNSGSTT